MAAMAIIFFIFVIPFFGGLFEWQKAWLLLDAEVLGGGLKNHAVNDLFRQMHWIEPDPAIVTGFGLLHGNVKPVLLLDRVAAPFVIAGLIRLAVEFAVGGMESLAQQHAARRAADNGVGITFGEDAAQSRAARAQTDIRDGSGYSSAAGEQTNQPGK
jgi:hypothetical protein